MRTCSIIYIILFFRIFYCDGQAPKLILPVGHTRNINSVNFSPDNRFILTAGDDRTAKLWEARSSKLLFTLSGHTGTIHTAKFSQDGRLIVTSSADSSAGIWDAATGKPVRFLKAHSDDVILADFSPNGKFIVTLSLDSTAKIWETVTGNLIHNLDGNRDPVNYANFSANGKFTVTSSSFPFTYIDSSVKIWVAATGRLLHVIKGTATPYRQVCLTSPEDSLAFFGTQTPIKKQYCDEFFDSAKVNRNGKLVITVLMDSTLKVWENTSISTGKLLYHFTGDRSGIRSANFSPDGKFIIAMLNNKSAKIWEVSSGSLKVVLSKYDLPLDSANFSPDSKLIVTTSNDSAVKIWQASTGKLLHYIKARSKIVNAPFFSPGGKYFVIALGDSTVEVRRSETGKLFYKLPILSPVRYVDLTPDGRYLITETNGYVAKVWDASTGTLLDSLKEYMTFTAFYSPDDKYILTANNNSNISNSTGRNLLLGKDGYKIKNLIGSFSFGDKHIITANGDTIDIMEASKGRYIFNQKEASGFAAAFSPDGGYFAISNYNDAKVYNTSDGTRLPDLAGHTNPVYNVYFISDGKYFVTFADSLKAWEVLTGRLKYTLHDSLRNHSDFSRDGKYIITSSVFRTTKIWNASSGELISYFDGASGQFSPDSKYIVTTNYNTINNYDTVNIFNFSSGKLVLKFIARSFQFSSYSTYLAVAGVDSTLTIINLKTGQALQAKKGNSAFNILDFSPDENTLITSNNRDNEYILLWETATGKLLDRIKSFYTVSAKFSPDSKYIFTTSNFGGAFPRILDVSTGKVLHSLGDFNDVYFGPDGKYVVSSTGSIWVNIFDTATTRLKLESNPGKLAAVSFSADGKYLAGLFTKSGYNLPSVKIFETATARLRHTMEEHSDVVNSATFSPEGKYLVTTSGDNSIKIWDVPTGSLLYSLIIIDSADYLNQIPSGYYMCTPDASKLLHYITRDLKVITFNQLDIKYNRPDKVLEAIGCPDTALIKSYRNAYNKRIKKLNVDTIAFRDGYSVPEAEFFDRDRIAHEQQNEKLQLRIHGQDSTYTLNRFNIWINEVPVFGLRGIDITHRNSHRFDTSLTVILSQGENHIETSISNVNGTESYRKPLVVRYSPAPPMKGKTCFLGIGINHFADSTHNLNWSVKDIRDLSFKLKEKYKDSIDIDTLFDDNVTVAKVKALKKKLAHSSVNDKVIIAYSGHGMLNKEYDYYLSTYNINFKQPEQNGLPYDELENLLDSIPARKKLLLIDACQSGEVDKEEMAQYKKVEKNLDSIGVTKGTMMENKDSSKVGMKNSFELMRELFVNVGKSTGATIISAAAGTQFALEKNNLQNGIFTYCILEYMQHHEHAAVNEIKQYVNQRVTELTGGLQVPTTRNENIALNWEVW